MHIIRIFCREICVEYNFENFIEITWILKMNAMSFEDKYDKFRQAKQ